MKKNILRLIYILLIILVVFELAWVFIIIPKFQSITKNDNNLLDMQSFKSYNYVNTIIYQYGKEGIQFYKTVSVIDIFFPLVYGALLFFIILYNINFRKSFLLIIPIFSVLFDYVENTSIIILLKTHPNITQLNYIFYYCSNILKFIFLFFSIIIIIYLMIKNKSEKE